MTNPTPHGQMPEALIDLIDAYAETRHRCGGIYNAKTEAARKAVIEALSVVQALSAAPAGWKLVPVEPTNEMQKAADEWAAKGFDWPKAVYRAMLAASPTPPAEQQAEESRVKLLAECRDAFHIPEPSSPLEVQWAAAMARPEEVPEYVRLCVAAMQAAPKAAPSEGGDETDWYHGITEKHFDRAVQKAVQRDRASRAATPNAAPGEPVNGWPVEAKIYKRRDEWVLELSGAINDCAFTCRHTQPGYLQPEDVAGLPSLYSEGIAPQQEAQEPMAIKAMGYGGSTGINDYLMSDGTIKAMRPSEVVWAAPQPAPAPRSDEDVKDAARYRWLRTQDSEDFEFAVVKNPHFDVFDSPEELDAAIDAALAAQGGK